MDSLKLRRIGDAVVIAIPDDVLDQLGLREGDSLLLDRDAARIELRPGVSDAHLQSADRMMKRYEGVLERLAK